MKLRTFDNRFIGFTAALICSTLMVFLIAAKLATKGLWPFGLGLAVYVSLCGLLLVIRLVTFRFQEANPTPMGLVSLTAAQVLYGILVFLLLVMFLGWLFYMRPNLTGD